MEKSNHTHNTHDEIGSLKRPRNGNQNFVLWRAMTWIYTTYWWTKIPVEEVGVVWNQSWKTHQNSSAVCIHNWLSGSSGPSRVWWVRIVTNHSEIIYGPVFSSFHVLSAVMMMLLDRSKKPPINISMMQYHIISSIYTYIYTLSWYICMHPYLLSPSHQYKSLSFPYKWRTLLSQV